MLGAAAGQGRGAQNCQMLQPGWAGCSQEASGLGRRGFGSSQCESSPDRGAFRGQTEAPFTPAWPPLQHSICRVPSAARVVPGLGGRPWAGGGMALSLLLPCPAPLGLGPVGRRQPLPCPSPLRVAVSCASSRAGKLRAMAGRACPSLAALHGGGAGPWLLKKGPIHSWHRVRFNAYSAEQNPPCPWFPGSWDVLLGCCFLPHPGGGERLSAAPGLSAAPPLGVELESSWELLGAHEALHTAAASLGALGSRCSSAGTSGSAWRCGGRLTPA